jgi:phenylalanine-4-hydroxylase
MNPSAPTSPHVVPYRDFSPDEHRTWQILFERQARLRDRQLVPEFSEGLRALGFTAGRIPDLREVNRRLAALTGFRGVPVEGFEEPHSFYAMLARREFPIGYFIRDPKDLGYTPAPDVFHDLYGHLPFLANPIYADFCHEFGCRTMKFVGDPERLREWERLFWFGVEFPLLETAAGRRIFGAGIASSFDECAYALGDRPETLPFDPEMIRREEFEIDRMQSRLFVLESREQLYGCLGVFEAGCAGRIR